ncbi:MAG: DUF4338 domain-containing protein [Verrucomicrobia bacterium]|nr:MAG: DUF4338 domain-containing protein [Verrucomicrobiota bacterium]
MRCVVEVEGPWVPVIASGGAARHTKARDRKTGWPRWQRTHRLHRLVNHSRFLVLPDRSRQPSSGSQMLEPCPTWLDADRCNGGPLDSHGKRPSLPARLLAPSGPSRRNAPVPAWCPWCSWWWKRRFIRHAGVTLRRRLRPRPEGADENKPRATPGLQESQPNGQP